MGALEIPYTSRSPKEMIATANHYQSLRLEGLETLGVRSDRRRFLDQLDFQGKTVLDLGSNLGEVSREARARGASLVDGLEYDPFFIEVANLANAYCGATRVSFFHRDITKPEAYEEPYDIVLALSVFTYIRHLMHEIAAMTREVFVLETHVLNSNLQADYMTPIWKHFPHYKVLGETEWTLSKDTSAKRAFVVFARDEDALMKSIRETTSVTSEGLARPLAQAVDN
jgi:SAM-dependent methyltransferase